MSPGGASCPQHTCTPWIWPSHWPRRPPGGTDTSAHSPIHLREGGFTLHLKSQNPSDSSSKAPQGQTSCVLGLRLTQAETAGDWSAAHSLTATSVACRASCAAGVSSSVAPWGTHPAHGDGHGGAVTTKQSRLLWLLRFPLSLCGHAPAVRTLWECGNGSCVSVGPPASPGRRRPVADGAVGPAPCLQVNHGLTLSDLPLHTLNDILYRLSDGWDIVTLGQVTPALSALSEDGRLWRKLCQYHFAEKQVSVASLPSAAGAAHSVGRGQTFCKARCFPLRACTLSCLSLKRTVTLKHPI